MQRKTRWAVVVAAAVLAASQQLVCLHTLRLRKSGVSDTGAKAFAAAPGLTALQFLDLGGNPIRESVRASLRERFGERVLFE